MNVELKSTSLLAIGVLALIMGLWFTAADGIEFLSFNTLLALMGLTAIVSSFGRKVGVHR